MPIDKSIRIQYPERFYQLFSHILRSKKLDLLSLTLLENPNRDEESKYPREYQEDLRKYHKEVVGFLERLRRNNYRIILASTNDPLLVQQALDILFRANLFFQANLSDPNNVLTGFSQYFVGGRWRKGLDIYKQILEDYKYHSEIIIFDDYKSVLDQVVSFLDQENPPVNPNKVSLIHLQTSTRDYSREDYSRVEGFNDFEAIKTSKRAAWNL